MDTIFGFPSRLIVEVDGEVVDVSSALKLLDEPPVRLIVDPARVLYLVDVHREAKRRVGA